MRFSCAHTAAVRPGSNNLDHQETFPTYYLRRRAVPRQCMAGPSWPVNCWLAFVIARGNTNELNPSSENELSLTPPMVMTILQAWAH